MSKKTTTKSDWKGGSRNVSVSIDKGDRVETTHYKETLHPIFPNSVEKTGTSTTKKR